MGPLVGTGGKAEFLGIVFGSCWKGLNMGFGPITWENIGVWVTFICIIPLAGIMWPNELRYGYPIGVWLNNITHFCPDQ